jgi:hypothetical protein
VRRHHVVLQDDAEEVDGAQLKAALADCAVPEKGGSS